MCTTSKSLQFSLSLLLQLINDSYTDEEGSAGSSHRGPDCAGGVAAAPGRQRADIALGESPV
jgi:hypothetical protein